MSLNIFLKYIEADNTLKALLHNKKIEEMLQKGLLAELYDSYEPWLDFLGKCHGEGYEDLSFFLFFERDETYVLLKDIGNGRYEFVREVYYKEAPSIPVQMSDDALELKQYIEKDPTMDNVHAPMMCLGRCAKYYRLWLFQYKSVYVLLNDLGNGFYGFYKEVTDLADAPIDNYDEV